MAMEISGEYRIPANRQKVWEALIDPAVLRQCIAGCKELDQVAESEFSAVVVAKVGPVSATFRGNVVLSDLDPPHGYTLTGQGRGGAAGFARMSARVQLAAEGEHTVLTYQVQAEIGGKLASVGSRLVQTVAKKNADDFFSAFALHLGGAPVQAPAPALQQAAAASPAPSAVQVAHARHPGTAPAWLVVFGWVVGCAFGYVVGHVF